MDVVGSSPTEGAEGQVGMYMALTQGMGASHIKGMILCTYVKKNINNYADHAYGYVKAIATSADMDMGVRRKIS